MGEAFEDVRRCSSARRRRAKNHDSQHELVRLAPPPLLPPEEPLQVVRQRLHGERQEEREEERDDRRQHERAAEPARAEARREVGEALDRPPQKAAIAVAVEEAEPVEALRRRLLDLGAFLSERPEPAQTASVIAWQ